MLNKITIIRDPLNSESKEVYQTRESIGSFLQNKFEFFPDSARIYFKHVAIECDVTPENPADVEKLETLEGEFYVVIYPKGVAVLIVLFVVSLAVALTYKPPVPNIAQRNTQQTSPNNELASRTNTPRPNGRIPDIFGTVRSTPDLITVPYSTFENNQEIENATMCVGRGRYEIHDAYDGETPINQIPGTTIEVYAPFTNITSGTPYYSIGVPITSDPLNVKKSNSVNGQTLIPTNGITWHGTNDVFFTSDGKIHQDPGTGPVGPDGRPIGAAPAFTSYFKAGDVIVLTDAKKPYGGAGAGPDLDGMFNIAPNSPLSFVYENVDTVLPPGFQAGTMFVLDSATFLKPSDSSVIDLSGSYVATDAQINTVTTQPTGTSHSAVEIFLDSPEDVAADWALVATNTYNATSTHMQVKLAGYEYNLEGTYTIQSISTNTINLVSVNSEWSKIPTGTSSKFSSTISTATDGSIGPFTLGDPNGEMIIANFVATSGLYRDDGKNQYAQSVTVRLIVTQIDSTGSPIGSPVNHDVTLTGSATKKDQVATTLKIIVSGRVSVKAVRISPKDTSFKGQVVDEVKWRDLYQAQVMPSVSFGNCTIVRSQTYATTGALSVKERKLNMLVTRQIPKRISGSNFSGSFSTNKASEILSEIIRDPYIGGRPSSEVDYDNIYDTCADIEAYFGTPNAAEFCYTFDKDGMTFEETISTITTAIFSTAYRRGSVIKIDFEKATEDSTLLFNHRNKLPNSEIRTVQFGRDKNYDGISYTWVSPDNDAIETLLVPATPVKAKKIESIGVRNFEQAYLHAHREYNKLIYQNTLVEFEAIAQGELVLTGDRILVADNTRTDEQDGDIISQAGLIVGTSQKVIFETGSTYTLFLQMSDGTTQSMTATKVVGDEYAITLGEAPLLPLVTDDDYFAKSAYILIKDTDQKKRAFLATERTNGDNNTSKITAVNYDDRYYQDDLHFF